MNYDAFLNDPSSREIHEKAMEQQRLRKMLPPEIKPWAYEAARRLLNQRQFHSPNSQRYTEGKTGIPTIGNWGLRLQLFRKEAGCTKADLARRTGLHPSTINRIEGGGKCNPETAVTISMALNVPMPIIFRPGEDWASSQPERLRLSQLTRQVEKLKKESER